MKDLINDAIAFIGFCVQGIAQSAPHIYTSALAFAPKSSKIAQLYTPRFRNLIDLDVGRLYKWPTKQIIIYDHVNGVTCVAFSPDGRRVLSCSWDGTIYVCDVETGQATAGPFVGHTGDIFCAVYSTDGKNILSASRDGSIRIWDTECGVVDGPVEHVIVPIDREVHRAAFSHNRKYIASVHRVRSYETNDDSSYYISIRDVETGSIVSGPFVGHEHEITCLAFSPDDKSVASGSVDGTICVWSTQTGMLVAGPLEGHQYQVNCISYSHDGTFIVSSSDDNTIRLWEVGRTPPQIRMYKGHYVAFSSDDRWIVADSDDHTVRVLDVKTGDVVVGPLKGHVNTIRSVTISPDGKHVASGSYDWTVRIWGVEADREQGGLLDGHDRVNRLALSNDRRHVASGSDDGTILFWDVETGELVGSPCEGHGVAIKSIAYSPDGKRVVSGYADETVRICEVASGRTVKELRGHEGWVYSVAFSKNGRYIASASPSDDTIRIWDAETGDCIFTLQERADIVSFSPDDKYVLSSRKGFRIWDVETGKLVTQSKEEQNIFSATFSHDGKLVATASNTVQLWDARTGEPVLTQFIGHTDTVFSVAFSPDDKSIVSGSDDQTVRVWDVSSGQTIMGPLRGHARSVRFVAFSHDGNSIFSASCFDKTFRIWSTEQMQPTLFTNESVLYDDGWVKGENGEPLFWVPIHHHLSLHRPNNTRVIGPNNETRINLTNARLGDNWSECYTP